MDIQKRAVDLLRGTERSLRDLMKTALSQGDYASLSHMANWAEQLRLISENAGPPSGDHPANNGHRDSPGSGAASSEGSHQAPSGRRARKGQYPKFLADGDYLKKVGWSKRKGAEYEQRAHKCVVDHLLQRIGDHPKERFQMDEILPVYDPDSGEEIPSYQVYLALAWLRSANLAQKHGHEGYSLTERCTENNQEGVGAVEAAWRDLPIRP